MPRLVWKKWEEKNEKERKKDRLHVKLNNEIKFDQSFYLIFSHPLSFTLFSSRLISSNHTYTIHYVFGSAPALIAWAAGHLAFFLFVMMCLRHSSSSRWYTFNISAQVDVWFKYTMWQSLDPQCVTKFGLNTSTSELTGHYP